MAGLPLVSGLLTKTAYIFSMATTRYEVFDAFRATGVPDDKARAAAEAMAEEHLATKGDIGVARADIEKLDREFLFIKWIVGPVIAVQVIRLQRHLR